MNTVQLIAVCMYAFEVVIGIAAGSAIGSGLLCLIMRAGHHESWAKGRSHCDSCGTTLKLSDLIPIVSYIAHHGKCRYCGGKIPPQCLYSELSFGFFGGAIAAAICIEMDLTIKTAMLCVTVIPVVYWLVRSIRDSMAIYTTRLMKTDTTKGDI